MSELASQSVMANTAKRSSPARIKASTSPGTSAKGKAKDIKTRLSAKYGPLAEALTLLFYPHVEVVVHDLATSTIAYVANAFSKRSVGDESLLDGDVDEICSVPFYGPYEKAHVNGDRLKSITVVLEEGGLLCINMDLSVFQNASKALSDILSIGMTSENAEPLIARDWRETANFEIREYLQKKSKTLGALTKSERIELVGHFDALGLFDIRGAAERLAGQLGMSRASLYRCLTDARKT